MNRRDSSIQQRVRKRFISIATLARLGPPTKPFAQVQALPKSAREYLDLSKANRCAGVKDLNRPRSRADSFCCQNLSALGTEELRVVRLRSSSSYQGIASAIPPVSKSKRPLQGPHKQNGGRRMVVLPLTWNAKLDAVLVMAIFERLPPNRQEPASCVSGAQPQYRPAPFFISRTVARRCRLERTARLRHFLQCKKDLPKMATAPKVSWFEPLG